MRRSPAQPRRARDGFALVEVTLALMLIGLLAMLALPSLRRATGPAALRVAAFQMSALLREDRNAALGGGHSTTTIIEAGGVRSGTSGAVVALPVGATAAVIHADAPVIRFFPNGRSSGGAIVIASATARFTLDVSPDTGAIHVASP